MKKISVIATVLLGAILIGAYVLLAGRQDSGAPADPGQVASDAPVPLAEPPSGSAATGTAAVQPGAVEGESIKSGAKTEFVLFGGEIGYVDPVSVAQEHNPYSVVALLQKHRAYTGADELLELEVESVGRTSGGQSAWLVQVIGEIPTPGRVIVNFESSGAVSRARGFLVDAKAAAPGNIIILQAEAEAIALEEAARFVEARRASLATRGIPLRVEASPPELRYALNPNAGNALRPEWRVSVGTYSPRDSLEVLVAADAGEVVSIRSVIERKTVSNGCTGLTVRVCDAQTMTRNSKASCGDGVFDGGEPVLDGDSCVAQEEEREKCSQADTKVSGGGKRPRPLPPSPHKFGGDAFRKMAGSR